jgi:hypothetical protein
MSFLLMDRDTGGWCPDGPGSHAPPMRGGTIPEGQSQMACPSEDAEDRDSFVENSTMSQGDETRKPPRAMNHPEWIAGCF